MKNDDYAEWRRNYGDQPVPAGFADRVLQVIQEEPTASDGDSQRESADKNLSWSDRRRLVLRCLMVTAASMFACLRIVHVFWLWAM